MLPLLLLDGWRNTVTRPSSSSQRSWRLFGMSLQTRYRPWLDQAGPSAHRAPVHKRWIGALGWRSPLNTGSTVRTSGSVKYVVGAPPGPKSRGGAVTVLGGATGPLDGPWARVVPGAAATTPTAAPRAPMTVRRDIRRGFVSPRVSSDMTRTSSCRRSAAFLIDRATAGPASVGRGSREPDLGPSGDTLPDERRDGQGHGGRCLRRPRHHTGRAGIAPRGTARPRRQASRATPRMASVPRTSVRGASARWARWAVLDLDGPEGRGRRVGRSTSRPA